MGRSTDALTRSRFILEIGSIQVGEFQECSGLHNESEVVDYSQGGENDFATRLRGRNKYSNIVLKHGVTRLSPAIWRWREATIKGKTPPLLDITIIMLNDEMEEFARFFFEDCWPMKWSGPDFKAGENALAVETLEIAHSGFGFFQAEEKGKGNAPPEEPFEVTIVPAEAEVGIGGDVDFLCKDVQGNAAQWKWEIEGETKATQQTSGIFNERGDRTVKVTATDANGQTSSATAKVKVTIPPFEIDILPEKVSLKKGEKHKFTGIAKKGGPIKTYSWTAEGKTVTDAEPEFEFKEAGEREVKLQGKDAFDQQAEAVTKVEVRDTEFRVRIEPDGKHINKGDKLKFKGIAVVGGPIKKFEWTIEDKPDTTAEPEGEFKVLGERTVKLKGTNEAGQVDDATATIHVHPAKFAIKIEPAESQVKKGEKLKFKGVPTSGGPIKSYTWTLLDTSKTDAEPEGTFAKVGMEEILLTAKDEDGTEAKAKAKVKVVPPPLKVKVDPAFKEVDPNTKVKFKAVVEEGGPIKRVEWTFPSNKKKSRDESPEEPFTKAGEHKVELSAWDEDGQEARAEGKVKVKDTCLDWKVTFTWVRDTRIWNNYIFTLPDKGPNGENIAYIHWDFGKQEANLVTRFRKQQKKPKFAFKTSGDTYFVKVLLRLQGFEHCAWVCTAKITPDRTKDIDSKEKKSTVGEKWHYTGPEEQWYVEWEKTHP